MSKSCTTSKNLYENVEHCPGQINLPGVRDHFYIIRKRDILKWPKLPLEAAESLDKVAVYVGDFTLAADAKWRRVDLVPSESEPKSEQAGSWGAFYFNNTIYLVLPGVGPKVTGLITAMNNDDIVAAVPQRDGQIRLFGDPAFNTTVKPSQTWGKGSNDANTTGIEIACGSMAAAPFYPGKIETDGGDISGATDELVSAAPKPGGSESH